MRFWNQSGLVMYSRRFARQFVMAAFAVVALLQGANVATAQQDVGPLIEQARTDFKPASEKQLAEARADALKQLKQVEQFVGPSSKNGQRWMKYLRLGGPQAATSGRASQKHGRRGCHARAAQPQRERLGKPPLPRAWRRHCDATAIRPFFRCSPKPDEFYTQTLQGLAGRSGCLSQRAFAENRASAERTNQHHQQHRPGAEVGRGRARRAGPPERVCEHFHGPDRGRRQAGEPARRYHGLHSRSQHSWRCAHERQCPSDVDPIPRTRPYCNSIRRAAPYRKTLATRAPP